MPGQINVLARDISKDDEGHKTELYDTNRILTYKAFLYLNANPDNLRYELIGQCDDDGNLIPGNPNLSAQHRQEALRSAEPVANKIVAGPSVRELELMAEIERLKKQQIPPDIKVTEDGIPENVSLVSGEQADSFAPIVERKKPGPKPKRMNSVTEVSA